MSVVILAPSPGYNKPVGPGCCMRSFHGSCVRYRLLAFLLVVSSLTLAGNTSPPKISKETRQEIVHAFNEELVYVRATFPMGKTGLKLRDGAVTPTAPELQLLMALWASAANPC